MREDDCNTLELKDAIYYKGAGDDDRNVGIFISWDGNTIAVPINEKNSKYQLIKARVDAGTLTIKDAD